MELQYPPSEAGREICEKSFIPEPIHISFLNKYDYVLEISMEFELSKRVIDLQKISQWFSCDVVLTCVVVPEDKLGNIGMVGRSPACAQV